MQALPSNESLRCFVAAADTLNFRQAAQQVGLTPAALGQRIRQLEEALDSQLFERTTRRVSLTDAGLRLLPGAQQALDSLRRCHDLARGNGECAPMELVIGTRHELGLSWLVPNLPGLRRQRDHLDVHLYFGSGSDLLHRTAAGEIDAAITSSTFIDPRLQGLELAREDYCLTASPKYLEAHPLRRVVDLEHHTVVDSAPSMPLFRYISQSKTSSAIPRVARLIQMGTIAAIRALVLRGEGVAVLPTYFVSKDLEKGRLVRVLPRLPMSNDHFRLIFRTGDSRSPVFERLATYLRSRPLR